MLGYILKYCSVWGRCYTMNARWAVITRLFLGNGSVNTFPLLDSRFVIMQRLDYNNGRPVFSTWSVPRCYKQGIKSVDSMWREDMRAWSWRISTVKAVDRKRLTKADLEVICKVWRERRRYSYLKLRVVSNQNPVHSHSNMWQHTTAAPFQILYNSSHNHRAHSALSITWSWTIIAIQATKQINNPRMKHKPLSPQKVGLNGNSSDI
jgi:hypothetical protein